MEEKKKKEERRINKRLKREKEYFLENNYEYLTIDVAKKYAEMAKGLDKCSEKWNELKVSLQSRYGITEIEAINILNNQEVLIYLYIRNYELIKNFDLDTIEEDFDDDEPIDIDLKEDTNMIIDEYLFEEND